MFGVVLIDKPPGITSHDVVAAVRSRFETRRVGHAGTLDPQATGLLVVAVGPATRFLQYLPLEPKEYVAEITFGIETTTQDREGDVVAELPLPTDLVDLLPAAVQQLSGLIKQIPPMYSAVKKDGQPLYKYARRGEDVEREPRNVHITRVIMESFESPKLNVTLTCSGGTYVRTWAHDLGQILGCGAHLSALNRTQVGKFRLSEAVPLDELSPADVWDLADAISPPTECVTLDGAELFAIRHGRTIANPHPNRESGVLGLLDRDGRIIGMGRVSGNLLHPECVIPSEAIDGSI